MGKGNRVKGMQAQKLMDMASKATMIEGDPKIRAQKCAAEINAVAQKYRCQMFGECIVSPKGITSRVQIEPIVDQEVPAGIINPN
jgi:hypothetical protein